MLHGSQPPRAPQSPPNLASRYDRALLAADSIFGGFLVFLATLALVAWLRGDVPPRIFVASLGLLGVNLGLSVAVRRIGRARWLEAIRLVANGGLAVVACHGSPSVLASWWPVLLVLGVGVQTGLGLRLARPMWSRLAVAYHVAVYVVLVAIQPGALEWYPLLLNTGVMTTAGLLLAELVELLAGALVREHERSLELRAARDALFAEVEIALEVQKQEHERSLELRAARDALFAEIEVAQEIQTLLLPKAPRLPGCEVVGKMLPASEVGGDYYDVLECHGRRFLAIGDVSGHGLTSGLAMMMACTTLVGALEAAPRATLGELYQVLNRGVRRHVARMDLSIYMTFVLLEYLGDGRFIAVGRHVPLLVYRRSTATVEVVELEGMWLGVLDHLEPCQLKEVTIQLEVGDQLFLYTDGIVEQFAGNEMFGFERLQSILVREAPHGPERVVEVMLEECKSFSSQQDDDVTMLVVERKAAAEDLAYLQAPAAASLERARPELRAKTQPD